MEQGAGPGGSGTTYDEQLAVPGAIWTVTLVLWSVFSLAMAAALGLWGGAAFLLVGGTGLVVGLRSAAGHVAVVDGVLVAGRAALPLAYAGETRAPGRPGGTGPSAVRRPTRGRSSTSAAGCRRRCAWR